MSALKIVLIGGGSINWTPNLASDLFQTPELRGSQLVLVDPDRAAAELMLRYTRMLAEQAQSGWSITIGELDAALDGADGVCACISTGGFQAMQHDVAVPEQFDIYHSVGDTVGPGGISRTLRNVPVFIDIARRMERLCPHTWLVHVTNPLAQLTRCVWKATGIRCLGLCHNFVGTRLLIARILQVPPTDIMATSVGVNHFTWLKDITCRGRPVGPELTVERYLAYEAGKRAALRSGTGDDAIADESGENSVPRYLLNFQLFERLGVFPVGPASHLAENFPFYLNNPQVMQRHRIWRKGVLPDRQRAKEARRQIIVKRVERREPLPELHLSNEGVASIMASLCTGKLTHTMVNLPNEGQIPNLPLGVVVETWGTASWNGVTPVQAEPVPEVVRGMLQLIIDEEELAVAAALSGDRRTLHQALCVSPLVADKDRVEELAAALLDANRTWLPQFNAELKGSAPCPASAPSLKV